MNEEKDLLVTKLSLIKQYRSVGYIAEVIDIDLDMVKKWLDGNIDDDIVDDVNKLLDAEFNIELKIALDDNELSSVKDLIKDKIIAIESKHGIQESLKLLGGVSVATFNRYKRGEIPMSNLLYIKSMVEDIQIEDVAIDDENGSNLEKTLGDKLKTKLSKSNKDKKESDLDNKVSLRRLNLDNKPKEEEEEEDIYEDFKDDNVEEKTDIINPKEEKIVSEKKEKNIIKSVFNGVEKELKEILGDTIQLKRVEFSEDKIIIEAGLKEED